MRFVCLVVAIALALTSKLNADENLLRQVDLAEPALSESSGLAFSLRDPGHAWTHNDSGHGPRLWCFDSKTGTRTGSCELAGVDAVDWEAVTNCLSIEPDGTSRQTLIVGDCGDNQRRRSHITLYRFDEPEPNDDVVIPPQQWQSLKVRFPDGPLDCEALWFDSDSRALVLLAKSISPLTGVYALKLSALEHARRDTIATCTKVATLAMPLATGGDRDPRTGDIWISTYWKAFCFKRGTNTTLPDQLAQVPVAFAMPSWKQIESIGVDGQSGVWVTTEGSPAKLGMLDIPPLSE